MNRSSLCHFFNNFSFLFLSLFIVFLFIGSKSAISMESDIKDNVKVASNVSKNSVKLRNKSDDGYFNKIEKQKVQTGEEKTSELHRSILTEEEKAFIKAHPVIHLGIDPEFFPFEYVEKDGLYSGISSDYIKILNERFGLNIQVVPNLSWNDVINKSKNKEIDILACVGKTVSRMSYLKYSKHYTTFQRVVIAQSDFPFIAGLNELRGLKVAVQANTSHDGFIKDKTNISPVRFKNLQDALIAVSNGEVDALIGNIASATYWIRKLNLINLKVAAPAQHETQKLYMAVRKDWSILASIVNKGLSSINHEEVDNIYKKWVYIEYEPGIAPKTVISYIIKIIAGAIILLLAFFAWNYRLKEEIIQRKKAEEKLQHYAKELEKANIHLKGLDKLKSMFVASMSHELRTPLNSIIGFTGVILQGMAGEINEQQKDQLSRVYRSAKHLLAIISDIIDISKIEAGKVNVFPESFMLAELIDEAVESVLQQLKKKKLSIEVDVPCNLQLVTDRKRLLQCMINFLSNAMKYTEHGGVKVSVREFKNEVEISTADTGIGVAEEDIPKLFMAFERIDTHLLVKAGGTGLGLYLTHKLATELLHGDIAVISEIGKGSTFVLRIPKIIEKEEEE